MNSAVNYSKENQQEFLAQLKEFLKIPSVSTDANYSDYVYKCAQWLNHHINNIGITQSEIIKTGGHPIVYAEINSGISKPTILIYGHYDVQPPDPISEWLSDPFDPVIIGNEIYARGACDDKGQVFIILKALESILKSNSEIKCNVKLVFEGEEEVGSVNLIETIKKRKEKFSADAVIICDASMFSENSPAIYVSVRGIVFAELNLESFAHDLHSGVYGGAVENPIHTLSKLFAGFHDENHRITVKGFYDDISELSEKEKADLEKIPFDDNEFLNKIGLACGHVEKGFSIYEARTIRPTLDANGIWGGYSGEGAKTIIPHKVGMKISCRLVANQNPGKIFKLLENHIEEHLPSTIRKSFNLITVAEPVVLDYNHHIFRSFARALENTFHSQTYYLRGDGSLPIVNEFKNMISPNIIITGFGLNSDAIHSANEKFGLKRFEKGIETLIRFFTTDSIL